MKIENFSRRLAFFLTAFLLALLPFHAFLWTWFHSFFWTESWTIYVQAWKEMLVGILALLAGVKFLRYPWLPKNWASRFALAFIILAGIYLVSGTEPLAQKIFGFRTDTLFLFAFLALQFFSFTDAEKSTLKKIVLGSGALVILFALAQKFFLPLDFLKDFGYSANVSAWLPGGNLPIYHLVEGEENLVRLQSTLAGPNQLGAYLLVLLPLIFSELWRVKTSVGKILDFKFYILNFLLVGALVTLYFTYSRSAWLGLVVMLGVFALHAGRRILTPKILIGGLGVLLVLLGGIFFQTNFSTIITRSASTTEHLEKISVAAKEVSAHPLGLGLGATAGVSQRFDTEKNLGLTPENTYLGIALETGWLGGILFLLLLGTLLFELAKKDEPLFYGVLGVVVIALFLHPLEDTPTALTLFILLALAITPVRQENILHAN